MIIPQEILFRINEVTRAQSSILSKFRHEFPTLKRGINAALQGVDIGMVQIDPIGVANILMEGSSWGRAVANVGNSLAEFIEKGKLVIPELAASMRPPQALLQRPALLAANFVIREAKLIHQGATNNLGGLLESSAGLGLEIAKGNLDSFFDNLQMRAENRLYRALRTAMSGYQSDAQRTIARWIVGAARAVGEWVLRTGVREIGKFIGEQISWDKALPEPQAEDLPGAPTRPEELAGKRLFYLYLGPEDDEIIRPFCKHLVGYAIPERFIPLLNNHQGIPASRFLGGYNCRHSWVVVTSDYVKQRSLPIATRALIADANEAARPKRRRRVA